MSQRAWGMRKRETHRRLVHLCPIHLKSVVKHKKSCEVLLICLYAFRKNLKTVEVGSKH